MKAVFFDWGGVLIDNPRKNIMSYLAGRLGLPKDEIIKIHERHDLPFQRGEIDENKIWRELGRENGIDKLPETSLWKEAFSLAYKPRDEMFNLVKRLRENGYLVGLISNTEKPAAEYFMEKHSKEFDSMTFSCRLRIVKPDPGIYLHALRSLKVRSYESAFVDDSEENIAAASRLGLTGILCGQSRQSEQVKRELRLSGYVL